MGVQPLTNPSISFTSYKTYDECPRRWLYQYAADLLPGAPVWPIKQQRKLAPWQTFAGKVVDAAISEMLRTYKRTQTWPSEPGKLARTYASRGWTYSQEWVWKVAKHVRWPESELGFQPLDRHFYEETFSPEETQTIRRHVVTCVENFMNSEIRDWLTSFDLSSWRGPREPGEAMSKFSLDGITVWAAPDFAIQTPEVTYIIDWKTGALTTGSYHSAMEQLHWYALLAARVWQVPISEIRLMPVWLHPEVAVEEMSVREKELDELEQRIKTRHSDLCGLLPEPGCCVSLDDFPHTPRIGLCKGCVFRQSCGGATRSLDAVAALEPTVRGGRNEGELDRPETEPSRSLSDPNHPELQSATY